MTRETVDLISELSDKHPHLTERQFAAEVWANMHPNRYDFNRFLSNYWEGNIPTINEISNLRFGEI